MTKMTRKQFIMEKYGLILAFILVGVITTAMVVIGAVAGFVPCMVFLASVLLVMFCLLCYAGAREYEDECGEKEMER